MPAVKYVLFVDLQIYVWHHIGVMFTVHQSPGIGPSKYFTSDSNIYIKEIAKIKGNSVIHRGIINNT